jgi:hypothetical protein
MEKAKNMAGGRQPTAKNIKKAKNELLEETTQAADLEDEKAAENVVEMAVDRDTSTGNYLSAQGMLDAVDQVIIEAMNLKNGEKLCEMLVPVKETLEHWVKVQKEEAA